MKKIMIACVCAALLCVQLDAQGLYFDAGLGVGKSRTSIDGNDKTSAFKESNGGVVDIGVDLGFKIGFGPFGRVPLYLVAEFAGAGHRLEGRAADGGQNAMQFNSYLAGAGFVFYPARLLQFAGSAGYSVAVNQSSREPDVYGTGGLAAAASAALDFGKGNHGFLLGVRGFYAKNNLETSEGGKEQVTQALTLFAKYAYRHKNTASQAGGEKAGADEKKASSSGKGFFFIPLAALYTRETLKGGGASWERNGLGDTIGLGYDFGRILFQFSVEYNLFSYINAEVLTSEGSVSLDSLFACGLKAGFGVKIIDGAVFGLILPLGAMYQMSEYTIKEDGAVSRFSYRYLTAESGLTLSIRCSKRVYLLVPFSAGYPLYKEAALPDGGDTGFEPLHLSAGLAVRIGFGK